MSVLVTGGAGFVGSHFLETLINSTSCPIICLDSFNDYYDPELKRANVRRWLGDSRVTVVEGDFCDADFVDELFKSHEFERIMHLGAYAGVRVSVESPRIYAQTNVCGTLNLLESSRQWGVERFVLASSSTVYGCGAQIPFVEDAPLGIPASPYGATKRAAELLGLTYHALHGVPVVCVRPFSVYGPGLRPDLAMTIFAKAIHQGQTLPLYGDGTIRRDFTHVRDICSGLLAALHAPNVAGEAINLGHSEPVEIKRLIELLAEALGKPAKIEYCPARSEDLPVTFADLTKAERLLDYHPQISLEEGIREYAEWFLRENS
jgi:UDP-glucuronate 4-epimerase